METQEELIRFEKLWSQAIVNNDAEEISSYMTDDWVIIGTEGGVTPKSSFLEWVKSGDLVHTQMDFEEVRIRIYGDTGVATNRGTSSGTYKGQPFSFLEWSTSVFIREKNQWRCILTMLTPAKN